MRTAEFRLGEFLVQPAADRITRDDRRIDLEPKTMAVLLALAARPGDVISSDELIHDVWQDRPLGDNPVYKAIAKLRRALDDEAGESRYIETIPRKGYRLLMSPQWITTPATTAPVTDIAPSAAPARFTPTRRQLGLVTALSIVLTAIGVGYATLRTPESPPPAARTQVGVLSVHFPGLESHSARIAAINTMIRERVTSLPGLTISEREVDRSLASLRLTGSAESESGYWHVRMRLDGERGKGLWSHQIELPDKESYRIADHVAAAVQEAANLHWRQEQLAMLSFSALQSYLQARTELRERRPGFSARMAAASREVLRLAPDSALGHAALSLACEFQAGMNRNAPNAAERRDCAQKHAARALALDPMLAEAHAASGLLKLTEDQYCRAGCAERQWLASAQLSLERAVRLDPSLPEARTWLGNVYSARGDLARGIEQQEAALALDPLSPIANANANDRLMARGQHQLAHERLMRLVRAPDMPWFVYLQVAENAQATGRLDQARHWARRATVGAGSRLNLLTAAAMLARSGAPDEARALYERAAADPLPFEAVTLYFAVRLQQQLSGPAAVRRMIDAQLARVGAPADVAEAAERDLRILIGWTLTLADDPIRAEPWLASAFGKTGTPELHFSDILYEAEGLESYAWACEQSGRTAQARQLAQSALDLLDMLAAVGSDQNTQFALSRALALRLAGQRDAMFQELERAYTLGWSEPVFLRQDPRWLDLAAEPAVQALLARVDERAAIVRIAAR